jgi:hypothetical protein
MCLINLSPLTLASLKYSAHMSFKSSVDPYNHKIPTVVTPLLLSSQRARNMVGAWKKANLSLSLLSLSLSLLHTANWGKQYSTDQPLVGLEIQQTRLEILVTTQEMPFTLAVSTRGVPSTLGAPVILIIIIIISNARIYQCTRRCTVPLTS